MSLSPHKVPWHLKRSLSCRCPLSLFSSASPTLPFLTKMMRWPDARTAVPNADVNRFSLCRCSIDQLWRLTHRISPAYNGKDQPFWAVRWRTTEEECVEIETDSADVPMFDSGSWAEDASCVFPPAFPLPPSLGECTGRDIYIDPFCGRCLC